MPWRRARQAGRRGGAGASAWHCTQLPRPKGTLSKVLVRTNGDVYPAGAARRGSNRTKYCGALAKPRRGPGPLFALSCVLALAWGALECMPRRGQQGPTDPPHSTSPNPTRPKTRTHPRPPTDPYPRPTPSSTPHPPTHTQAQGDGAQPTPHSQVLHHQGECPGVRAIIKLHTD